MAGTMSFGIALVLLCTVVSTVNCRALYSPNVDQLSAGETDSQRVRRDSDARPGAMTNKITISPDEMGDIPEGAGLAKRKPLCDKVLTPKNRTTKCSPDGYIYVLWTPADGGVSISVYNNQVEDVGLIS